MKITNIILSLLFLSFAIVQYNDPDPWIWISIYVLIAMLCGLAAAGRFQKNLLMLGALAALITLGVMAPEFIGWLSDGMPSIVTSMKAETPYIELVREFLGVLIVFLTLVFLYWQARKVETA